MYWIVNLNKKPLVTKSERIFDKLPYVNSQNFSAYSFIHISYIHFSIVLQFDLVARLSKEGSCLTNCVTGLIQEGRRRINIDRVCENVSSEDTSCDVSF